MKIYFSTWLALFSLLSCRSGPARHPFADKPNWSAKGEDPDSRFGFRACYAGDVNHDGYSDLIVGAPGYAKARGKAYLYLGGPKGLSPVPAWTMQGEETGHEFGDRVGSAGDLNGDGYGDLFIAAPSWRHGFGKLYVFYGAKDATHLRSTWSASGTAAGQLFGDCTIPTGDLNGDGYDDLAIGAYGYDGTRGQVSVFYGSKAGLAQKKAWQAEGEAKGDQFGYGICGAVDLNGDGYDDLVVASKYNSHAYEHAGRVYIYYGSAQGVSQTGWVKDGPDKGANLGTRVYGVADQNGDKIPDLLLAAPYSREGKGLVMLLSGGSQGMSQEPFEYLSPEGDDRAFGFGLGPLGSRFFISSVRDKNGRVGIYEREPKAGPFKTKLLQTLESPVPDDRFGQWCAPAGDVNGDGAPDLCVSAYGDGAGRVDVFYGSGEGLDRANASKGYFLGSARH